MPELPLREIRKQLGRAERVLKALIEIQRSIPLPPPSELEAMIHGETPLSAEAYLLAILQFAVLRLEEATLNVRNDLLKENFTKPALRDSRRRLDIDLASLINAVRMSRDTASAFSEVVQPGQRRAIMGQACFT